MRAPRGAGGGCGRSTSRSPSTPAATSGSPTRTSTARTIQRMPDSSATKGFGLAGKIFLGSTLLVVGRLGATFGVTSFSANRTADASIHRALLGSRSAVDDYLAARTRTLGRASTVATDVPQYRQRLLNQRERAEALDQAREIDSLIDAAWVLATNGDGVLIARTDYPDQFDRNMAVAPLVPSGLNGEQTSGARRADLQNDMVVPVGSPLRHNAAAAAAAAL